MITRLATRRDRVFGQEYNEPGGDASLIVCSHCDLLQRLHELALGSAARCPRCDKELWRCREDSMNRTLALTRAAAVLYVIANSVPMPGLTIVGRAASTTVLVGVQTLWQDGQEIEKPDVPMLRFDWAADRLDCPRNKIGRTSSAGREQFVS